MSDTTTYKWLFDLKENALTSETTNDYVAIVRTNKSLTIEDIASSIASDRTDLREDTIIMVANLIEAKVRQFVCQGNTVVTANTVYRPTITGVFIGKEGTMSDGNKCKINISPSSTLRAEVEEVEAEFSKYVLKTGGAVIALVTDNKTGATDGTITPGGQVIIKGEKIKCIAEDGVSKGVIKLINIETNEETLIDDLSTNTSKQLNIVAPASLKAGSYTLVVETYYTGNSNLLKSVRTITYDQTIIVNATE